VAEQTVEGVQNAEDGWRRRWNFAVTTLLTDVAMRARNPKEGAPRARSRVFEDSLKGEPGAGKDGSTLKRRRAYERMNPVSQESGGRCRVKTVKSHQKW